MRDKKGSKGKSALSATKARPAKKQKVTEPTEEPKLKFSSVTETTEDDSDDEVIDELDNYDDVELSSGSENEEQEYERRPRKWKGDAESEEIVEKLPIKVAGGGIKRVLVQKNKYKRVRESESEDGEEDEQEVEEEEEEGEEPVLPERDQIRLAKEELSKLASDLVEDPEENVSNLKKIFEYQSNKQVKIKQLAIATQLAVYKDIIPGYRIRPLTDAEKAAKVSKEVKKLRSFEQSLVYNYKQYVDSLNDYVKKSFKSDIASPGYKVGSTALSCACGLLVAVPHFNFRSELITIVSQRLGRRRNMAAGIAGLPITHRITDDAGFNKCIQTIITLFQDDEAGSISLDAVQIIAKMMKMRKFKVDEAVLNTFLHLRLLTELRILDAQKRESLIDNRPKLRKKDRVHRTKKERKLAKEIKGIEEEMKRAEHAVSKEETERLQSEALKVVFATYLTILKERVNSLMGATLEGLARFAHLINADLFGDLLEVLKELIRDRQLQSTEDGEIEIKTKSIREALLCIVTAFALLSGQAGESIGLDLSFFITYLYGIIMPLSLSPDIEYSSSSLRLDDPLHSDDIAGVHEEKVNLATEMEMVVKAFDVLFFNKHYKTVSFGTGTNNNLRMVAFAKRLCLVMLHFPDKSCYAAMKMLENLCVKYSGRSGSGGSDSKTGSGALAALFSTEDRVMNGLYRPEIDEPELSNPAAANIWETFLLEKHYSPRVAESARRLPLKTIGR
ncbi:nucleolar complex-associated protein-domain-containing protein [Lipomyces tetrasporus]|uniref:Nucleolar complex-associated protein 3 n=1 Tax=Lipomyces tetrasporus TaxID=54092 RepID=A0AAD7VVQ7_9ASCO|nr:nucleolar complex-associated protein-domain-containing protein [Lipomyces tetrasporus]KAJ8103224.1 nucleolar complex-associated protein-domain-containing protein [Lipomyces tetrasporus]